MPKEPRQRNRDNQPKGDTLTRNLVLGMVGLVVLSGVIFTVLDRQSSGSGLPAAIEKLDAANNGPALPADISAEDDLELHLIKERSLQLMFGKTHNAHSVMILRRKLVVTLMA